VSRQIAIALAAGILFGAGLAVSGMADPTRVRAFLDIFGKWDPTLAFVMGGALAPMIAAWRFKGRFSKPVAAPNYAWPETQTIDRRLIVGAGLFGIGWGVAGLCPGPAIVDLVVSPTSSAIFVAAMLGGMALHRVLLGGFPAKNSTNSNN
jgi:uncharacterized membrane protein YedE/YeeE